jgi:hypothetical protein
MFLNEKSHGAEKKDMVQRKAWSKKHGPKHFFAETVCFCGGAPTRSS